MSIPFKGLAPMLQVFDIPASLAFYCDALLKTKLAERHGISTRGEPVAAAIREREPSKVRALPDDSPKLLHTGDLRSNQPIRKFIEAVDEFTA